MVTRCCAEPVSRILKDYPEMPVGGSKNMGYQRGAATTKNVAGKLLTTTLLPGLVFWIGGLSNFGGSWIILYWFQVMSQKMVMISMCMALTDTKDITQTYWVSLCTWLLAFATYLLGTFYYSAKMKELCRSTPPKTNMRPENNLFERENHLPSPHFGVHFG